MCSKRKERLCVVNCFQILYIRSLNTIHGSHQTRTSPVVNCFQILYIRSLNTIRSSFFCRWCYVVNCFQILYIRSLNTITILSTLFGGVLWIAFRFCIFVLWTQSFDFMLKIGLRCELLSDFVYSFFEHNSYASLSHIILVVNCFQILYIRSLNTILAFFLFKLAVLWIAFRFCIFVLWTQSFADNRHC